MSMIHLRRSLLAALVLGAGGCVSDKDDSGDSGDSADSTDDTGTPSVCEGGSSLLDSFGNPSGFEQCPDGSVHRVEALPTDATNSAARCAGTEDYLGCTADADCTDRPNGACITGVMIDAPDSYCGCVYSCASDADCNTGEFCAPAGLGSPDVTWSQCQPADCTTDADCASGDCGLSVWHDGCSYDVDLSCRSPDDCRSDADCGPQEQCGLGYEGSWGCQTMNCAIGRPLTQSGEALQAPTVRVEGWAAPLVLPRPADPARRAALAARWAQIAAMEHASVGSFARFTLELLALGAPPELLAEAQRAAADEVRHAQLAYSVASALQGAPLGPGPLDTAAVLPNTRLADFARALVQEACVGETLGALEAAEAARACADPTLRAALTQVAEDEARHAALAWRTLGWALRSADPALRRSLREAAQHAAAALLDPPDQPAEPALGLLDAPTLRRLRAHAIERVVGPCLDAALGA